MNEKCSTFLSDENHVAMGVEGGTRHLFNHGASLGCDVERFGCKMLGSQRCAYDVKNQAIRSVAEVNGSRKLLMLFRISDSSEGAQVQEHDQPIAVTSQPEQSRPTNDSHQQRNREVVTVVC